MSPAISEDRIFEASANALIEGKEIVVVVSEDEVAFKLPTTRKLAESFGIPNYYILPFFSALEDKKLLRRVEREGIFTTNEGSKKLLRILEDKGAEEILGRKLLDVLIERVMLL